ncbi:hypothetical protein NCAS_0C01380 [Naumovozyma castellii]|uniref:Meiosis protein 5 n=1 Tax=Naumovozyma castellii TaxID=27288 RepID=G0VCB9_NAUCA|nr:hypothetical protein NCAS_0C01380 [Naumovozyma castellii CBS 4309]CCC69128.1 hypothetical protein NCAS_0C01380 [Naumovozyma castellii CBS 4309]
MYLELKKETIKMALKTPKGKFKSPFKGVVTPNSSLVQKSVSLKKAVVIDNNSEETRLNRGQKLLVNELDKQIRSYERLNIELIQAIKYLDDDNSEELKTEQLINKWRDISQSTMAYLLNSILNKIDKMGGYEEFRQKEIEREKTQLEYQLDDGIEESFGSILESDEFKMLSLEDQDEYKQEMETKLKEMEEFKQKQLEKFEKEMENVTNKQLDMKELSKRLNVEYDLVFPED